MSSHGQVRRVFYVLGIAPRPQSICRNIERKNGKKKQDARRASAYHHIYRQSTRRNTRSRSHSLSKLPSLPASNYKSMPSIKSNRPLSPSSLIESLPRACGQPRNDLSVVSSSFYPAFQYTLSSSGQNFACFLFLS